MVGWLVGWLVGLSVVWTVDWSVSQSVGQLSISYLVGLFASLHVYLLREIILKHLTLTF